MAPATYTSNTPRKSLWERSSSYIYIYKYDDDTKTFRLIKECDLQFYDGVASSPNCKSQTEEESFEY